MRKLILSLFSLFLVYSAQAVESLQSVQKAPEEEMNPGSRERVQCEKDAFLVKYLRANRSYNAGSAPQKTELSTRTQSVNVIEGGRESNTRNVSGTKMTVSLKARADSFSDEDSSSSSSDIPGAFAITTTPPPVFYSLIKAPEALVLKLFELYPDPDIPCVFPTIRDQLNPGNWSDDEIRLADNERRRRQEVAFLVKYLRTTRHVGPDALNSRLAAPPHSLSNLEEGEDSSTRNFRGTRVSALLAVQPSASSGEERSSLSSSSYATVPDISRTAVSPRYMFCSPIEAPEALVLELFELYPDSDIRCVFSTVRDQLKVKTWSDDEIRAADNERRRRQEVAYLVNHFKATPSLPAEVDPINSPPDVASQSFRVLEAREESKIKRAGRWMQSTLSDVFKGKTFLRGSDSSNSLSTNSNSVVSDRARILRH